MVIPAYNAEDVVARAIESVLNQSRKPDEIIVVDDGSSDATDAVVGTFGDRVHYIRQENKGAGGARNTGIVSAKSEWVAFLDADDEWLPEKLDKQCQLLQRNPKLVWATGNHWVLKRSQKVQGPFLDIQIARQMLGRKEFFENYFRMFTSRAGGWTGTMIIRKDVLIETGLFREHLKPVAEDIDLWWRIAHDHPQIGYVAEPLARYYNVPDSLSQNRLSFEQTMELVDFHLGLGEKTDSDNPFTPVASFLIRMWIRAALFRGAKAESLKMLRHYQEVIPVPFRFFVRLLLVFPQLTASVCRCLSFLNRKFRIRQMPIRDTNGPSPQN